jgi:NADPH:quinone reductase
LRATHKVKRGQTVLFHAAAGGVGLIFSQWAKALGVKVIGTVGSDAKIQTALDHGCAHVINSATEDVAARVHEITKGQGVPVVYDGVGKATFETSLKCLSLRGTLVSFGNASGPVTGVSLGVLTPKSAYITRPTLFAYTSTDAEFQETAQDVVDIVKSGKVKIAINQRYALKDVAKAHEDLEARRTTGASVLLV